MTGVIERKSWRLYDMDGSRYPLRSLGCGLRRVIKKHTTVRLRLEDRAPRKHYVDACGLWISKDFGKRPGAMVDVMVRVCIANANKTKEI